MSSCAASGKRWEALGQESLEGRSLCWRATGGQGFGRGRRVQVSQRQSLGTAAAGPQDAVTRLQDAPETAAQRTPTDAAGRQVLLMPPRQQSSRERTPTASALLLGCARDQDVDHRRAVQGGELQTSAAAAA